MQIELTRDATGHPVAVRLRFGAPAAPTGESPTRLRRRLRRIGQWRPMLAVKRLLLAVMWIARSPVRLLAVPVRVAWRIVPRVRLQRDPNGRPDAIRICFGEVQRPRWIPGLQQIKGAAVTAATAIRSAPSRLVRAIPNLHLRRDDAGAVTVVVRPSGAYDLEGAFEGGPVQWVIEPVGTGLKARLVELWQYRRMLRYFGARSIKRMYQGSSLGILWLFVRPLLPIFISSVIFGRLLGLPSDGVPYFLFFLTGTMVWMLFERSLLWVTRSLSVNKDLIKKVYVPRLLVPISAVAPTVVDFFTYGALFLLSSCYYLIKDGRWYPRFGPFLLFSLLSAALAVCLAIAVGLWTSVWQVKFRETRFTLRYVMRFWNYLTPVMYPLSKVPQKYHWVIFLNPMAPLVETFKWGLLGIGELNWRAFASSVGLIFLMILAGVWYFGRSEGASVDTM